MPLILCVGETWFALYAPAGIPAEAQARLSATLAEVLRDGATAQALARFGAEPAADSSAAALAALQRADTAKWAQVIQDAGIRPE